MAISSSIRLLANLTHPTKNAYDRLERDWSPDSPPETVAAATIASAFGGAIRTLTAGEIEAVGNLVERLLQTADETTRNAVATGFLESLLAQASRGSLDFRDIAWMLGPESAKYCLEWDKFSGVTTAGLDVRRRQ